MKTELLIVSVGFLGLLAAAKVNAQPAKLEFEVASVKPSPGATLQWLATGPGGRSPERFTVAGVTLRGLLSRAFTVNDPLFQISGPSWIDSEQYSVNAKVQPGTTKEQFQQMLQTLLAERFKLVVHRETKMLQVYELQQAKNGHKLRKSSNQDPPAEIADAAKDTPAGFPRMSPLYNGYSMKLSQQSGEWTRYTSFRQIDDLAVLLIYLKGDTHRFVLDKTGLSGSRYDYDLAYELLHEETIFGAVEQQLGLRLVDAKDPVAVIVVDSVERVPTEN
jgi:uncharacterized protein (TIGR03435 family)